MKKIVLLASVLVLLSTAVAVGFVRPVKASGTIYIRADGSIEGTTDISTVDNVTYTFTDNIYDEIVIERDNIVVDGAGYTVQGTGGGTGILIYRNNVTLKNVEVTNFFVGILLSKSSNNNTLAGNNASNNEYGIHLGYCSNNTLIGNIASSNNEYGIWLSSSNNNTVTGNTALNNEAGIYLWSSSNNTLTGNTASNNGYGIYLEVKSSNNTLADNTASNNFVGILLGGYNNLTGNIASNNEYGIILKSSNNNTFIGNTVSSNNRDGIRLDSCSNNTLTDNTASNNRDGISLYKSSNNVLLHNNFINNTQQVYDVSWDAPANPPSINIWDDGYPSGGNYWSDYTGVDSDHDGIGDTAHVIDANNTDNYPLMGMFSDFKATLEYHVQTICNSSISDFQFNGTAISFNVSGENGTTGFCRIRIPTDLMNGTYKVFVNGTEVPYTLLPFSDSTHSYLYFTYNHSTQEVIIIPEFPTWTSFLLILIVITVVIIIYKRRLLKTSTH